MSVIKEFREFAIKGNMVDLAIGVIIGGAFGSVVTSLVNNIIMPPLGLLMGGVNFADKGIVLKTASESAPAIIFGYGLFINALVNFLIIAAVIFLIVKQVNRLKRTAPAVPSTKKCPRCMSEIPLSATKCAFCTADIPL